MPTQLAWSVRLARARDLIALGDAIYIPPAPGGHVRSSAIQRARSKYYNARKQIGRLLASRPPATASASEIREAHSLARHIAKHCP